jgi:N-hydroxyarylamine O-acetyltransferase
MDIQAYLKRINYSGTPDISHDSLRELQRKHMVSVPFENLDIHLGIPIVLDEGLLFEKIVNRRRGGFCCELNGLFAALLRELGYNVQRLACRVSNGTGGFGIEFGHMALLVTLGDRWLVDVGFGASFLEPLRLDDPDDQIQMSNCYRIRADGEQLTYWKKVDDLWAPQYSFTLQAYSLGAFTGGCHHHQTSPESWFTRQIVVTRATLEGRITMIDRLLKVASNGSLRERVLERDQDYLEAIRENFGIVL